MQFALTAMAIIYPFLHEYMVYLNDRITLAEPCVLILVYVKKEKSFTLIA